MAILFFLCMIYVLEAWLEVPVIELKNINHPDYTRLNKQEHFRSAVWAGVVMISAAALLCFYNDYWLIPAAFLARRIWFDYLLILLRRRPKKLYEGNDWWNNKLSALFGKNGRQRELILEVLVFKTCILMHLL